MTFLDGIQTFRLARHKLYGGFSQHLRLSRLQQTKAIIVQEQTGRHLSKLKHPQATHPAQQQVRGGGEGGGILCTAEELKVVWLGREDTTLLRFGLQIKKSYILKKNHILIHYNEKHFPWFVGNFESNRPVTFLYRGSKICVSELDSNQRPQSPIASSIR